MKIFRLIPRDDGVSDNILGSREREAFTAAERSDFFPGSDYTSEAEYLYVPLFNYRLGVEIIFCGRRGCN